MESLSGGGTWALAFAILSAAILWFFKTPKEVAGETNRRIDDLEDAHHRLDVRTSIAETRLSAEIKHLADTIIELSRTIKQMDQARTSGNHRRQ